MKVLHDVHTHNIFSSCCSDRTASTAAFVEKEASLGNKIFGLSNHIWDEGVRGASSWYSYQTIAKAKEAKASLANAPADLRCLFGAETEYYHCHDRLGMSEEGAKAFDYLLVPHSHQHMRNEVMWDYPEIAALRERVAEEIRRASPWLDESTVHTMVNSLKEAHLMKYLPDGITTDIAAFITDAAVASFHALCENETFIRLCRTMPVSIAHPFNLCSVSNSMKNGCLARISDETLRGCFAKAKKVGAYCEINLGSVSEQGMDLENNQLMRVFAAAKAEGCQFTFGTDSHTVEGLGNIKIAGAVCDYLGLTPADVAEYLRDGVEA